VSAAATDATPTVVYIAGYGRSGSTWLARLLGQVPGASAAGELSRSADWIGSMRACACGTPIAECDFWSQVRRGLAPGGDSRFWRAMLESPWVLYFGFWWIPEGERRRYRDHQRALFRGIAAADGARVVVDSSKTARRSAGRAEALQAVAGLDVRVVHLVRNPQGVRASIERGTNKELEGRGAKRRWFRRARAFAGWTMANTFALRIARRKPEGAAFRLDFEILIADPLPALASLAGALGLALSPVDAVLRGREAARPEHLAEGNRMRLEPLGRVKSEPARSSFGDRLLGFLLCGWTCWRLGISPFGADRSIGDEP
jgi:sulfotransferase family protein